MDRLGQIKSKIKTKIKSRTNQKYKQKKCKNTNQHLSASMIFCLEQTVKTTQAKTDLLRITLMNDDDYDLKNSNPMEALTRRSLLSDKFSDWNDKQLNTYKILPNNDQIKNAANNQIKHTRKHRHTHHRRYCTDNSKHKQQDNSKYTTQNKDHQQVSPENLHWDQAHDRNGCHNSKTQGKEKNKVNMQNECKQNKHCSKDDLRITLYLDDIENKQKIKWKETKQSKINSYRNFNRSEDAEQTRMKENDNRNEQKVMSQKFMDECRQQNKTTLQINNIHENQQIKTQLNEQVAMRQTKTERKHKTTHPNSNYMYKLKHNAFKQREKPVRTRNKSAQLANRTNVLVNTNRQKLNNHVVVSSVDLQPNLLNNQKTKADRNSQLLIKIPLKPTQFQLEISSSINKIKKTQNYLGKGQNHVWKTKNSLNNSSYMSNIYLSCFSNQKKSGQIKVRDRQKEKDEDVIVSHRSKKSSHRNQQNQSQIQKGKWVYYSKKNSNISRVYKINSNSGIKKQFNTIISLLKEQKKFKHNLYQYL